MRWDEKKILRVLPTLLSHYKGGQSRHPVGEVDIYKWQHSLELENTASYLQQRPSIQNGATR